MKDKKQRKVSLKQKFAQTVFLMGVASMIMAIGGGLLIQEDEDARQKPKPVMYSDILRMIDTRALKTAVIQGQIVEGMAIVRDKNGVPFAARYVRSDIPKGEEGALAVRMIDADVMMRVERPVVSKMKIFSSFLDMILNMAIFILMSSVAGGRARTGLEGWTQSRARLVSDTAKRMTFADVAGLKSVKNELQEIVDFIRDPERYRQMGGHLPRGVLFSGPPGTGKTFMARALAGEARVPFFTISGSSFVEVFAGTGAARVRDMFAQARAQAPCIIFIDEIDSIGRMRSNRDNDSEREQTLNQLLVEMDGMEVANRGVTIVAATNRPDILDPALTRAGRFDRSIVFDNPDCGEREEALRAQGQKMALAGDVDFEGLARRTPGYSYADLRNLANEAALRAGRQGRTEVSAAHFEQAREKLLLGNGRRAEALSPKEREAAACNQAARALVSLLMPGADPAQSVSILQYASGLGATVQGPEGDHTLETADRLHARLVCLMATVAAEHVRLEPAHRTNAPANDMAKATALATAMVRGMGLSQRLGPLDYGEQSPGERMRDVSVSRTHLTARGTEAVIKSEIRRMLEEARTKAEGLLRENRQPWETLARVLGERETLDRAAMSRLLPGLVRAPI